MHLPCIWLNLCPLWCVFSIDVVVSWGKHALVQYWHTDTRTHNLTRTDVHVNCDGHQCKPDWALPPPHRTLSLAGNSGLVCVPLSPSSKSALISYDGPPTQNNCGTSDSTSSSSSPFPRPADPPPLQEKDGSGTMQWGLYVGIVSSIVLALGCMLTACCCHPVIRQSVILHARSLLGGPGGASTSSWIQTLCVSLHAFACHVRQTNYTIKYTILILYQRLF
jgi:hypothetical protein